MAKQSKKPDGLYQVECVTYYKADCRGGSSSFGQPEIETFQAQSDFDAFKKAIEIYSKLSRPDETSMEFKQEKSQIRTLGSFSKVPNLKTSRRFPKKEVYTVSVALIDIGGEHEIVESCERTFQNDFDPLKFGLKKYKRKIEGGMCLIVKNRWGFEATLYRYLNLQK